MRRSKERKRKSRENREKVEKRKIGERERDPFASFLLCARFIHCDGDVEAEFLNSGYLPPGVRDQVRPACF